MSALPIFVPYEFPQTKDGQFFAFQSDDRIFFSRRQQLNLTQQELADRAGVGLRFLRELEAGKPTLRMDKVNIVLDMFGQRLGVVPNREEQ